MQDNATNSTTNNITNDVSNDVTDKNIGQDTRAVLPGTTFSLPVDPEHGGLRIAVVGVFFVTAAVVYMVASALLPAAIGINIIAIAASLAGATLLTQTIDRFFKQRWPSGRVLQIQGDRIQLALRGKVQRDIDGVQHVNVYTWRFEVNKRTRIPKGWYMIATALVQDDHYLPVYTFVSPEDFNNLPHNSQYVKLTKYKEQENQDMKLAGQLRRLRFAEEARWMEGAEMSKADYLTYIAYLQRQFPVWMPSD
ncbi:MAG TPA: hypothetical protein VHL11_11515 [Phototrophicaceae bacterium]|jgi:hypothetical protein|nr:hypothetical protein [Phototrophicaceae bacterium]